MPYDPERDMAPASLTWELPNVFVVPTDHVPAKTLAEFLAWAKQKGRVSYGSPGVGTSPHLSGVMFAKQIEASMAFTSRFAGQRRRYRPCWPAT